MTLFADSSISLSYSSTSMAQKITAGFNLIINTHSELWRKDDTPIKDRDRAFYAYRYYRLFDDIMRLLEKFPDVGSNDDYWHIVATVKRYRDYYERK